MSSADKLLVNPTNGVREQTWSGFSWPCLAFGCFWFLAKSLYGWALISFAAAIFTGGLSWFVFPFLANTLHTNSLVKAGYLSEGQAAERSPSPDTHLRCPDCAELVRKEAHVCRYCGCRLVPGLPA